MARDDGETEDLMRRADDGEKVAVEELLARYRGRQMIALRMDPRLAARLDASDVVQETLVKASRKFPEYLQDRPLPFYPWLRQIAWEQLVDANRRHVRAQKRAVGRHNWEHTLPHRSTMASTFGEHMRRIHALEVVEQWREVVGACLEMERARLPWNIFPYAMYPNLAKACSRLGPDYLESGQFDEDLEPYEEAARIDIKHSIARVLVAAGAVRHDPEAALPYALQVVQAKPDNRFYRNTLGITYYRLGRNEEAIETLQEAVDRLGGGVPAAEELFFLAMAEWQRGSRDQARQLYNQAVEWMGHNKPLAIWTDQLMTYRYEAAQLMGIPGAPRPAEKDRPVEDRQSV